MLVFHYLVAPSRYLRLLIWPDRPPVAYFPLERVRFEVDKLERYGVQISPPPGPLGLRPVVLSAKLIECWLPEEEWRHWKGACRVRSGMANALERIEEEILRLEADPDFTKLLCEFEPPAPFNKLLPPTTEASPTLPRICNLESQTNETTPLPAPGSLLPAVLSPS